MGNFYTDVLMKRPEFTQPNVEVVCRDMQLLEPGTRSAVNLILASAKQAGIDLRVNETFRSQARQHYLFTKGFTKLSKVGMHGYGLACDFAVYKNNVYDDDGSHYAFLHALAVRSRMISGQGWGTSNAKHTFIDWPHVQRVPLFRQNAIFAGEWYPPEVYDPWLDMTKQHIQGIG